MRRKRITKGQLNRLSDLKDKSEVLSFKKFEEEDLSTKARELFKKVFNLVSLATEDLQDDYGKHWKCQVLRASSSIYANLAEGYGTSGSPSKLYYLRIARGSAFETMAHFRTNPVEVPLEIRKLCREICSEIGDKIISLTDKETRRILNGGEIKHEFSKED